MLNLKLDPRVFLLPLLTVALSLEAQAQRTWIVDYKGGGDYKKIQDAINAASDGDTIFVKLGGYGPCSTSKALHFRGEESKTFPSFSKSIKVSNLRKGQTVTFQSFMTTELSLANNAGHVHCVDVQVDGMGQ